MDANLQQKQSVWKFRFWAFILFLLHSSKPNLLFFLKKKIVFFRIVDFFITRFKKASWFLQLHVEERRNSHRNKVIVKSRIDCDLWLKQRMHRSKRTNTLRFKVNKKSRTFMYYCAIHVTFHLKLVIKFWYVIKPKTLTINVLRVHLTIILWWIETFGQQVIVIVLSFMTLWGKLPINLMKKSKVKLCLYRPAEVLRAAGRWIW